MKILLIGGAGFIGSHLTRELLDLGHEVTIIDNKSTGAVTDSEQIATVWEYRKKLIEGAHFMNWDFLAMGEGDFKAEQFDIMVHLAATPLEKSFEDEASHKQLTEDIALTYKAVLMAKKYSMKKFVYMSSLFAYGDFENSTDEDRVLKPKTAYGISKAASEFIIKSQLDNWNIVRTTSVYGFGDLNNRVTSILINKALKHEKAVVNAGAMLDFIYIKDLVKGLVKVILGAPVKEDFHISGGDALPLLVYALLVEKNFPGFIYERVDINDRPQRGTLENEKAQRMLGWQKEYSLSEGFYDYCNYVEEYNFA